MGDEDVCETSTITGCTTYVTYSVDTEGTTTATRTTSYCNSAVGCEPTLTDSTTVATATATPGTPNYYVIYPENNGDSGTADQVVALLYSEGVDTTDENFWISSSANLGVNFWYAPLTTDQFNALSNSPAVSISIWVTWSRSC